MDPVNRRSGHVVVVWQDMTLIFGGAHYKGPKATEWSRWDPATIHCHQDGIWTTKITTGEVPVSVHNETAQVIGDNLYLVVFYAVHKLDLTTFIWSKMEPRGTRPLGYSHPVSWVRGEKIFLFGGYGYGRKEGKQYPSSLQTTRLVLSSGWFFNNQLVYYDCQDNSWNWPMSYGDIPSPRAGAAAFSVIDIDDKSGGSGTKHRSFAFVMGGSTNSVYHNDLYILDLDKMIWKAIRGSKDLVNAKIWPGARRHHSLTPISKKFAVLYGGHGHGHIGDCWLLNIQECISEMNAEKTWTQCKHHVADKRSNHKSVIEPSSKRVWIVGGSVNNEGQYSDHITELPFSSDQTLKVLALESVTRNIDKLAYNSKELPDVLRLAIESKAKRKSIIT